MEIEGAKTVVFGIGGVGCRILNSLVGEVPKNTGLIALDKDQSQLEQLRGGIDKVRIGESLNKCESFEEIKKALSEEIGKIESSLSGVNMAMVVMGLGGKTGACIGQFIVELCTKRQIFTLAVPIYPLTKGRRGSEEVDSGVDLIREKADGVIIVDNNLKRDEKTPMLNLFKKVNGVVKSLINSLIISISSMGFMNLNRDELQHFFYGDLFFVATSGDGKGLEEASEKALKEVDKYAESSHIKRSLVLLTSPSELTIQEMRGLNSSIQERLNPDSTKWIGVNSDRMEFQVILVSAVSELPLVQGVKMPDHIESDVKNPDEKEKGKESVVSIPRDTRAEEVKSEFEEFLNMQLEAQRKDDEEEYRSPALIGLEKGGEGQKSSKDAEGVYGGPGDKDAVAAEPEVDEDEEIEDIVNELVGFPSFKKKGQKKLNEYQDDLGIDYI